MPLSVKNIAFIRQIPQWGSRLAEALTSISEPVNTIEQQGNFNVNGQPAPPPAIQSVNVQSISTGLHVAIQHDGPIYRGVRYFVEHADNPNFTDPQIQPMGESRNVIIPTGGMTRYVRAYAAYPTSPAGNAVYHGSQHAPVPITGGANNGLLSSQGSGTGMPGEGLQGPGVVPFRTITGAAPVRNS